MKISAIVAADLNNVIGKNNQLLWKLSDDLKRFKELTTGHFILMGYSTFLSLGKPLPNRKHLVITRKNLISSNEDVKYFNSITTAIDFARKEGANELFVIGGGQIYKQCLGFCDLLYLTRVHARLDGDTFFPELNPEEWFQKERSSHHKDDKNEFDFDMMVFERKVNVRKSTNIS